MIVLPWPPQAKISGYAPGVKLLSGDLNFGPCPPIPHKQLYILVQ